MGNRRLKLVEELNFPDLSGRILSQRQRRGLLAFEEVSGFELQESSQVNFKIAGAIDNKGPEADVVLQLWLKSEIPDGPKTLIGESRMCNLGTQSAYVYASMFLPPGIYSYFARLGTYQYVGWNPRFVKLEARISDDPFRLLCQGQGNLWTTLTTGRKRLYQAAGSYQIGGENVTGSLALTRSKNGGDFVTISNPMPPNSHYQKVIFDPVLADPGVTLRFSLDVKNVGGWGSNSTMSLIQTV